MPGQLHKFRCTGCTPKIPCIIFHISISAPYGAFCYMWRSRLHTPLHTDKQITNMSTNTTHPGLIPTTFHCFTVSLHPNSPSPSDSLAALRCPPSPASRSHRCPRPGASYGGRAPGRAAAWRRGEETCREGGSDPLDGASGASR